MAQKLTNKLLCLPPEVQITGVRSELREDIYSISFPEEERICPNCGSHHCVIKSSPRKQTIRHIPLGGRPTFLAFSKHRYLCRDCGSSFNEQPAWLHPTLRISSKLYFDIMLSLTDLIPISIIASNYCVTGTIVKDVLSTIPLERPENLPHTLCIDEFKGDSGIWDPGSKRWVREKFQVGIADAASGTIIDILPDVRASDVKAYFFQYPLNERKRVEYFCCDMHNGYTSVAKACFPDAVICIDLFHVIKRLNDAIDEIRRRLQNDARDNDQPELYEMLRRASKTLLTKKSNQEKLWQDSFDRKKERLDSILDAYPDLSEAYDALQEFHVIVAEKEYVLKRLDLSEWLKKYLSSEVPEVRSAAATIKHWRGYIQNGWKYDRSNGPCEGLNNKIKVLKRISFGVHDFESFRRRILLTCGYIHNLKAEDYSYRQLLEHQTQKQSKNDQKQEENNHVKTR